MSLIIYRLLFLCCLIQTMAAASNSHINITAVRGYFYQDEPDTDPSHFDYVCICSLETDRYLTIRRYLPTLASSRVPTTQMAT